MSDIVMISIPKTKYDQLIKSQNWLRCLEMAGVDNWDDGGLAAKEMEKIYPEGW